MTKNSMMEKVYPIFIRTLFSLFTLTPVALIFTVMPHLQKQDKGVRMLFVDGIVMLLGMGLIFLSFDMYLRMMKNPSSNAGSALFMSVFVMLMGLAFLGTAVSPLIIFMGRTL